MAPFSGPAGLWGPSCQTSALLAAREVNESGGLLGRELELTFIDAGRDPEIVTDETLDLVEGGAEAVIGMHISAVRQALVRALRGRVPYVYTPVYEGGEKAPGVFMVGETPALQLRPSIAWLVGRHGARRWYLMGNDYVWPRVSHRAARRYVAADGGEVVGESYVPFGCEDYDACLDCIRKAHPDAILVSMVGSDCVTFNRAFADAGLDRHILRLSAASEENTLLGIGAENAANFFFAAGYLSGLQTDDNLAFLDRYHGAFGREAPVPNTIGQSCYEGVRFYAELGRRAQALDIETLGRASQDLSYVGARGRSHMMARHLHTDIYLAQADGLDFRVVQHFPA
ncbi:substrate-binding domain-containing protein [Reyranella sp.]|uniref:substrate-binding domain-containing protein n=1 Tax=Reyranella sp. TaxID=1929291 RepID=UPI002F94212A